MPPKSIRWKAQDLCLVTGHLGASAHLFRLPHGILSARRSSSEASNEQVKREAETSLTGNLPRLPWQRKPDTRNIVVDDLEATIDAHRRSNLTGISDAKSLVRRCPGRSTSYGRDDFGDYGDLEAALLGQEVVMRPLGGKLALDSKKSTAATVQDLLSRKANERGIVREASNDEEHPKNPEKHDPHPSPWVRHMTRDGHASLRRRMRLRPPPWPPENYVGRFPSLRYEWNHCNVYDEADQHWSSPWGRMPWLRGLGIDMDSDQRLHQEIKAFEQYLTATPTETIAVEKAMGSMRSLVADILPSHELVLHGSWSTGLATATSDIDYSVTIPGISVERASRGPSPTNPQARKAAHRALTVIQKALADDPRYSRIDRIHARIPLVTAIDKKVGLTFQFQSLAAVTSSREYTSYYLNELPSLRPLLFVIRHGLQIRGLCSVFFGGFGTYTLLMMIVAALKHEPRIQCEDWGVQLKHVLRFYADADLTMVGFAAEPPATFAKRTSIQSSDNLVFDAINLRADHAPYLLCLQDPANPSNDLGCKSHQIKHVQALFRTWLRRMEEAGRLWDMEEPEQRLAKLKLERSRSILGPVAAAIFQRYETRRKAILGIVERQDPDQLDLRKYLV